MVTERKLDAGSARKGDEKAGLERSATRRRRPPTGPQPMPLSPRQNDVLKFVRTYIHEYGHGPTRAEISQALNWKDRSTANVFLAAIERKSWIQLKMGSSRYVRLLHDEVPVVATGPISAGEDILAYERIVDQVRGTVASWFNPYPDLFVELHDDSMRGAGLVIGDLIAVHAAEDTDMNGKVVIVRRPGEIVLRRLRRIDERCVRLSAEPTQGTRVEEVLALDEGEVQIEGVMVGALIGPRAARDQRSDEEGMAEGGINNVR